MPDNSFNLADVITQAAHKRAARMRGVQNMALKLHTVHSVRGGGAPKVAAATSENVGDAQAQADRKQQLRLKLQRILSGVTGGVGGALVGGAAASGRGGLTGGEGALIGTAAGALGGYGLQRGGEKLRDYLGLSPDSSVLPVQVQGSEYDEDALYSRRRLGAGRLLASVLPGIYGAAVGAAGNPNARLRGGAVGALVGGGLGYGAMRLAEGAKGSLGLPKDMFTHLAEPVKQASLCPTPIALDGFVEELVTNGVTDMNDIVFLVKRACFNQAVQSPAFVAGLQEGLSKRAQAQDQGRGLIGTAMDYWKKRWADSGGMFAPGKARLWGVDEVGPGARNIPPAQRSYVGQTALDRTNSMAARAGGWRADGQKMWDAKSQVSHLTGIGASPAYIAQHAPLPFQGASSAPTFGINGTRNPWTAARQRSVAAF